MVGQLDRKPENWLSADNIMFSQNGSVRLQWLLNLTPRPTEWVFPGGSTTISLFEACSFCYVNGQFLASMILGLSFVEHTLNSLFAAAGRKGQEDMDIETLGREALSEGLITEDIFNDIVDAGNKRNTILPFRKPVSIQAVGNHFDKERRLESSGYEADAKRVMVAVSHFLDKSSI